MIVSNIDDKFNILADEVNRLQTRIDQIEKTIEVNKYYQSEFNKNMIEILETSVEIHRM